MGLWMKCPGCQAKTPIYLKVCSQCGLSLDNLPPEKRVYVVEEAAGVAPKMVKAGPPPAAEAPPSPPPAPAKAEAPVSEPKPTAKAGPKAEKKPRHPKKKKG